MQRKERKGKERKMQNLTCSWKADEVSLV